MWFFLKNFQKKLNQKDLDEGYQLSANKYLVQ